jgi:hypothetical protein
MARSTQAKPPGATETENSRVASSTSTTQATSEAETLQRQEAERVAGEREKQRQAEADLAEKQREELAAGGDGSETIKAASESDVTLTTRSITDPKGSPVDYGRETMRRTPQRTLAPGDTSADARPVAPIVNLPYGAAPRTFDPATGLAASPSDADKPTDEETNGADQDADVDSGLSAATRAATAGA